MTPKPRVTTVVSGRTRMRIDYPVRIVRPPDADHGSKHLRGLHDQRGALSLVDTLTELMGRDALDAAPATHTPGPEAHFGNYEGATLDGPPGMGSAQALSEYEGVEYQETNNTLRDKFRSAEAGDEEGQRYQRQRETEVAARVADIDQTMAVSRLTADVRVERAIRDGQSVFGNAWWGHIVDMEGDISFDEFDRQAERWEAGERPNLTGLKWHERGYVSTTADPVVAGTHYAERWTRFKSGLDGEPIVLSIHVPAGTGAVQLLPMGKEAEILLERDLTIEITADHGIDEKGIRRLDAVVHPKSGVQKAVRRLASASATGQVPDTAEDRAADRLIGDYAVLIVSLPIGEETVTGPTGMWPTPRGSEATEGR